LKFLDAIFGVDGAAGGKGEAEETISDPPTKSMLETMTSTKWVLVVFETEADRNAALNIAQTKPLVYEGKSIVLTKRDGEPETALWDGFGTTSAVMVRNICVGVVAIFLAVIFLDIFFYLPYVTYLVSNLNVKGGVGGGALQGTLLGLLICVCNQLIYLIIGVIGDQCGFMWRIRKEQFYVVGYTAAVFFNTVVDLWTVMLLAQGFSAADIQGKLTQPDAMMKDVVGDGILSPKAIAEQPSVQRSVYSQLLMYLFPGCLLIPFLLEPLALEFLTYYLPKWLVKSRVEIDAQEAEQRLAAPPYDLSRYGDILMNVMLCTLALAFTYRDLYMVFAWMTTSLLIIYAWDHFRCLRVCQRSYFASDKMEITTHWILAVPCAILMALLVFHAWSATDNGFLEPTKRVLETNFFDPLDVMFLRLSRNSIIPYMILAFLVHLAIHWSVLYWVVPKYCPEDSSSAVDLPYQRAAKTYPANWFNANPVHCLRMKYIYGHSSPGCIPYVLGKEYLLQADPKTHQYFNQQEIGKVIRNDIGNQNEGALRQGITFLREDPKAAMKGWYGDLQDYFGGADHTAYKAQMVTPR
jgi:hypothetical protein